MTYRKFFTTFLLLLLFLSNNIFSLDIYKEALDNPFPSEKNLNEFNQISNIESYDQEALDNIKISLITITPGDPVYSWFGHSAIMVEQEGITSLIYDYGVFSFNSDNFVENFLLGKMYYLLLPSNTDYRLAQAIEEEREIRKLEILLPNNKKLDIVNFLNFNSQDDNRTYLYDFYLDNCATRIRDILNWVSDGEFKEWALNQYSPYTYRSLSSKELSRSYFINWCLNAFLGPSTDYQTNNWENMFLPQYLEQYIIEYNGFNTKEIVINKSNNTTSFNSFNKQKHNILFYSLFSLLISIIALFLKTKKQDNDSRLYGFLNLIINLFLLIIALTISFFVFYSNITAAFNNENILILNPIISTLIFLTSFLTLSKKENSNVKLITYEKLCTVYSLYLLIYLILKCAISDVLIQQNFIIIIPLFIYYSFQGLLLRTKN